MTNPKQLMNQSKAEELWDWCLTEVLKLENGKDVWEQIGKVKDFAVQEGQKETLEEVKEGLNKLNRYQTAEVSREAYEKCKSDVQQLLSALKENKKL